MTKHLSLLLAGLSLAAVAWAPISASANDCKAPKADREAVNAGKRMFIGCASCHGLSRERSRKIGPELGAMFDGEPLAAKYQYSPAFRKAAPNWRNRKKLDAFLANPSAVVPGTKMVFAGVPKAEDRKNLIAYLVNETGKSRCR